MSHSLVFVDTNVFVYALDDSHPDKRQRASDLIAKHRFDIVVATQVLIELHAVCTRKLHLPLAAASEVVAGVAAFRVIDSDRRLVFRATELATKHQLSIFDAMIVAAAQRGGCTILFSEDLNAAQRFDDVVVVNPFV